MTFDIGFREAREMWTPKLIDILNGRTAGTERSVGVLTLPIKTSADPPADHLEREKIAVGPAPVTDWWMVSVPRSVGYAVVYNQGFPLYGFQFYDVYGNKHVVKKEDVPVDEIVHYSEYGVSVYLTQNTYGPDATSAYYDRFGLDRVEIPADCPRLTAVMPRAVQMFNERYAYRMLNSETLEQWQMRLQHVADLNVYRYERALTLYATNAEEISNVLEKKTTERDATSENSGSDSTTYGRKDTFAGSVKNIDTPDSAINASDDYADSLTKSDNSNTASGTDTLTHGLKNTIKDKVVETREPEGGFIPALNDNIDAYRDIAVDFVREFENNFMNVFWY